MPQSEASSVTVQMHIFHVSIPRRDVTLTEIWKHRFWQLSPRELQLKWNNNQVYSEFYSKAL